MTNARMLGNYVSYLTKNNGMSNTDLSNVLDCSETRVNMFLKGRAFLSYPQLKKLSNHFGVSIKQLLAGDHNIYNATVIHCDTPFNDKNNREIILDIIDQYMDVVEAIS